jgi:flagellar basal-body rod protein FlgG
MTAQNLSMDVIANNLANVSTTGYKKSHTSFQELIYQHIKVPGAPTSDNGTQSPTGIQVGLGVTPAGVTKVFTEGDIIQTDNQFDIAIEGNGFFQIELPNGNDAYTRAGNFNLDGNGQMVTTEGYPLIPTITIPDNAGRVTISENGIVSAVLGDDTTSTELGNIDLATFVNDAGLLSIGRNLYRETESSGTATIGTPGTDGYGLLLQAYLENSNVNMVNEMAQMITTQRAFEINSKAVSTSDEMMQTVTNMV